MSLKFFEQCIYYKQESTFVVPSYRSLLIICYLLFYKFKSDITYEPTITVLEAGFASCCSILLISSTDFSFKALKISFCGLFLSFETPPWSSENPYRSDSSILLIFLKNPFSWNWIAPHCCNITSEKRNRMIKSYINVASVV